MKTPEGGYLIDGRLVLWRPESILIPQAVGGSALEEFDHSNAWVGWWLRIGLAELLVAQSAQGRKEGVYRDAYVEAADVLQAEGDAFKVYNLLETQRGSGRRSSRDRALAMTLVDYLMRKSRRGLQQLVGELKSPAAPRPPANDDDFDTFFIDYVSHQDAALRTAFRMSGEALDEQWKEFVAETAEKIKKAEAEERAREEAEENNRQRRRRGGR